MTCGVPGLLWLVACSSEQEPASDLPPTDHGGEHTGHVAADAGPAKPHDHAPPAARPDAGDLPAPDAGNGGSVDGAALTFDDVAPIFERHCVSCHRADGAGPFRLDTYEQAASYAGAVVAATQSGHMPPWHITADGSCGEFADVNTLSPAQLATLERWSNEGAQRGQRDTIDLPTRAGLADAQEYVSPAYRPVAAGGPLAEHDDYHCVLIDPELPSERFITAYEISPGAAHLVHHAIAYVIDPSADSRVPGLNNGALIDLLDAASPDQQGWSCLVEAGDGVTIHATPATWFPGQPPMALPNESGVRVKPHYRYVLQVHYNLQHGAPAAGHESDSQVKLRLRYADTVKNEGFFLTGDGMLASLAELMPAVLAPGRASEPFRWSRTLGQLGLAAPRAQLWAVYPHMHELGHKYKMTIQEPAAAAACVADVQDWDFHWQRMYQYQVPLEVTPESVMDVTCDYDTTSRSEPTLPGMSTTNEMCSGIVYVTAPLQ